MCHNDTIVLEQNLISKETFHWMTSLLHQNFKSLGTCTLNGRPKDTPNR